MSERGDSDYKPNKQALKTRRILKRIKPVRSTRTAKEYDETVLVTDSVEESAQSESEGAVAGRVDRNLLGLESFGPSCDNVSVISVKSEPCWSPYTTHRKTDNIMKGLSELQSHLTQARMAQQKETSLADVL